MALLDDLDEGKFSEGGELLRRFVPGYEYRNREQLSRTDKKLREKFHRDLTAAMEGLDRAHDRLYDADRRAEATRVATLRDETEMMRRRVETAPSGNASFEDLAVKGESDLLRLVEFDANLVETSEALSDAANAMVQNVEDPDLEQTLTDYEQAINEFRHTFKRRQSRLDGLR